MDVKAHNDAEGHHGWLYLTESELRFKQDTICYTVSEPCTLQGSLYLENDGTVQKLGMLMLRCLNNLSPRPRNTADRVGRECPTASSGAFF